MTEKQRNCIDWICETLGVKYYGGDNKHDAWKFINRFMEQAKERVREYGYYNAWSLNFFFSNPF